MNIKTKILLDSNINYKNYLRYNSYWYKTLIRDENKINDFIKEYKEKNKLRVSDKIESLFDKVNMVTNFINVLR